MVQRILQVEDDLHNRMLLHDYLTYRGYKVVSLENGASFLRTVIEFQPDIILLDLRLPGLDGFALLQQLQEAAHLAKVPVIVVSAYAFKADQKRAFELGAKNYLVKPIKITALDEAIEAAIG